MRDPSDLPFEIFDQILDAIVMHAALQYPKYPEYPDGPGKPVYPYQDSTMLTTFRRTNTAQQLHSTTLVSRKWHTCSVSKIYSHWHYDGLTQGLARLWKFYCTVRSNQGLARLVRSACVEHWDSWKLRDWRNFSQDDKIMSDGIFGSDRLVFEDVTPMRPFSPSSITHFEPLMAVIMTYLPNLTRLIVIMGHGDPFLASLMRNSACAESGSHPRKVAFQLLKEGAFYKDERKTPPDYGHDANYSGPLLEDVWPAWYLPRIENLTISGLPRRFSFDEELCWGFETSVTNFTLAYSTVCPLNYTMALTTLGAPAALAKLSLYFTNSANSAIWNVVTYTELWTLLVTYQHSLQHLDVYREIFEGGSDFHIYGDHPEEESSSHSNGDNDMGLLCGLSNLETLRIQPEVLLGGSSGTHKAPLHLKDALPLSLRSLTLYDSGEDKDIYSDLDTQLIDVVHDRRYASLGSITLEDQMHGWWNSSSTSYIQTLKQTCEEAKIELWTFQGCDDPSERMARFPALPGLERVVFHAEQSEVSDQDMLGEVRQTADLGYGSSMIDKKEID